MGNHLLFLHEPTENGRGFRKESGHEMYCNILTVIETLKRRDMPILEKIKKLFMGTPAIF